MLDTVLDLTYWPLKAQRLEAMGKRRIGLGFTGLADAMLMLGLRYDSEPAREQARSIARRMRDEAYLASVRLAEERGAFPMLDVEKYLATGFAARLPLDIKDLIRKHGIRNSHLLSIAPTGTISLAFGDNCSSGIEPVFEWSGSRSVKQPDGSWKQYPVEDHALRRYKAFLGLADDSQVVAELPDHWVRARDIDASAHLAMVEAVAPYIDTAISKTINVAADYPYAAFKDIYQDAWRRGLKGVTTFRPSNHVESVLHGADDTSADANAEASGSSPTEDLDDSDPDRRLKLQDVPTVSLASLRWVKRPQLPAGNPAWCNLIDHPQGYRFAVFVGHIDGEMPYPFEVWVNGAEQPRGLGALAKSVSMDMRSEDRGYLALKLDSLMALDADDAFDLIDTEGRVRRMSSLVAGFAYWIYHRCETLGTFRCDAETPLVDALLFRKEPKTGPDGTLSWTVDVRNEAMGDDFVLWVKELTLPDGTRRPYSVWLSGAYPKVLDGLCKSLSFDMRISDPAWVGAKLRQLLDYAELHGDFWARVPGADRTACYPSTVAYLARLLVHRYAMLGILDREGFPVEPVGAVHFEDDTRIKPERTVLRAVGAMETAAVAGALCEACGTYAVIPRDGCRFCTSCGATGSCG